MRLNYQDLFHFLSVDGYKSNITENDSITTFQTLITVWIAFFSFTYLNFLLLFSRVLKRDADVIEEYANRAVSSVNAVICCWTFGLWFWDDLGRGLDVVYGTSDALGFSRNDTRDFSIGVIIAYLVFDLVRTVAMMVKRRSLTRGSGISMILHHVICSVGFYIGVHYQYGTLYLAFMVQNEVSTPLLNLRFFMADNGLKTSILYFMNDVVFALLFFVSRVVGNILVFKSVDENFFKWDFASRGIPMWIAWILPLLGHAHVVLQLYWFAKIVRMVLRGKRKTVSANKVSISPKPSNINDIAATNNEPIQVQTKKCAKMLGLPDKGVKGKAVKQLGLPEVANSKAARFLGLSSSSSRESSDEQ